MTRVLSRYRVRAVTVPVLGIGDVDDTGQRHIAVTLCCATPQALGDASQLLSPLIVWLVSRYVSVLVRTDTALYGFHDMFAIFLCISPDLGGY